MTHFSEFIENCTISISEPGDLVRDELIEILKKYSVAVIRNTVQAEQVEAAKTKLRQRHAAKKDRAGTGESPDEIRDNFQKLSIGGAEQSGVYRPRCMRTFYNPVWAEDIYGMRGIFQKMAKIRNVLYGNPINYAVDKPEGGFWTAARIHHFPAGGGFLVSHRDDVVPVVQQKEGIEGYFQPVLVMSKKGDTPECDFSRGGGFFELNGNRHYYEESCDIGDIVIYDGTTIHGVADIDTHKPFNQSTLTGRFSGFVTLYRVFERKGQLSDYIETA